MIFHLLSSDCRDCGEVILKRHNLRGSWMSSVIHVEENSWLKRNSTIVPLVSQWEQFHIELSVKVKMTHAFIWV